VALLKLFPLTVTGSALARVGVKLEIVGLRPWSR
jgi:hypothetical protein